MKKLLMSVFCLGALALSSGVRAETVNVLDEYGNAIGPLTTFLQQRWD